jgi:Flp pilus assembly protein TadB
LAADFGESRLRATRAKLVSESFAARLALECNNPSQRSSARTALTDLRLSAGDGAADAASTLKISELWGVNASASLFVGAIVAAVQPGVTYIWLVPALAGLVVAIMTSVTYKNLARQERLLRSIESAVATLAKASD